MKQNGFTLTEMLAVIVVLAVILTVGTGSYLMITGNIKETAYENKLETFERAATKYATDKLIRSESEITVQELYEEGYLVSDDEFGNILDPREETLKLNCYSYTIKSENGVYTSTIKEIKEIILSENCN